MRRRTPFCLLALSLSACERVTAPQALVAVDKVEETLWRDWTPDAIQSANEGNFYGVWKSLGDSSSIVVVNNGATDRLHAAVIERVFIPPPGGGAPFSRRSLVAWSEHVSYGLLAVTQTSPSEHSTITSQVDDDPLRPRPVLVAPRARNEDWWIPGSGTLTIDRQPTTSQCPFANGHDEVGKPEIPTMLTCEVGTYIVEANGDLVRRFDAENKLVPDQFKQHHQIVVGPQQVQGIRFIVHCPDRDPMSMSRYSDRYLTGCGNYPFPFWRSNDLFAPSLGVDIAQMKCEKNWQPMICGHTLRAGRFPRPDGPRMVRWTLSYPDGTVKERGADTALFADEDHVWLAECSAYDVFFGGRRQCLIPEMTVPKWRSRYRMLVLDMEEGSR